MPLIRKPPKLLNCEELKVRQPHWVWYPYIPANCATMVFGVGGIGKSYLSCELAAAFSAGRKLPGQAEGEPRKHNVLLMSAEDSPSAVIKPRLIKCGADLKRVFIPDEPFLLDKWGLGVVQDYMEKSQASIVIIDPIVHYMGGKIDMNKMNEVRAITGALHQKAMNTDSAIIILHHARKGTEGQGYEKAAGSADFVNAVRSVLYAHKTNDGTSVVEHVKTNYGVHGKALAFFIDEEGFHWIGDYTDVMIAGGAVKRDEAAVFLKTVLEHGPVAAKEIASLATDEGFTLRTLNRAKTGIVDSIMRYDGQTRMWFWRLRGDVSEPFGVTLTPAEISEKFLRKQGLWPKGADDPISE